MTEEQAQELWQQTLDMLRKEVSAFSFEQMIEPLKLRGVTDHCIFLECTNPFTLQVLSKRYNSIIMRAVQLVFGESYVIDILSENEAMPTASGGKTISSTAARPIAGMKLNPRYTFETFVVGQNNRFAQAAATAVAEMPAEAYNPLFLWGGVGLGKTHLMHAIGNQLLRTNPDTQILYMTSEEFTNQVIAAIANKTNQELRDRLRSVDLLMVDDIQFIAGKVATQEEFFHTFNQLRDMNKQIVISSDKPPKDIPTLEERLRTRFEWGLVVDIGKPDFETRVAILNRKAEQDQCQVPPEVIAFIAENVKSNIRELEGALNSVTAQATLYRAELTVDFARNALTNNLKIRDPKRITSDLIMQVVCEYFGLRQEDMVSTRRSREISDPRQMAMFLCREMTDLSLPRIGAAFGGRDHTTVMHACDKVAKDSAASLDTRKTLQSLRQKIQDA